MTEKKDDEELRIKTALNLARIQYGRMMIDDSRGDDKMVKDGQEHIHDGFEALLSMFDMGATKPNFPFKLNERILYSSRIKDKDGMLTDKIKWHKGFIESFGHLGYENRPDYIILKFDDKHGGSRHLDYYRAMMCINMGKLKRED